MASETISAPATTRLLPGRSKYAEQLIADSPTGVGGEPHAPDILVRSKMPIGAKRGSVFVGDYSAQAAGDYASGPNHVLPTAGVARFRGGLSVMDFVKLITVQELSAKGLRKIAPAILTLAETEGLRAHADSIRVRCPNA